MRRSLFRPVAVLVTAGGLVFGTALPALAHHPELSGSVVCTAGKQIITWTVRNSETTSGSNKSMTIDRLSASSGTVVGLAVGALFPPKPLSGSTKTATTTLPGTQTGTVTLTVRGDWNFGGTQDVQRTVTVTLPGQCTAPTTTTTTTTTTLPPTTTTTQPPTTTTTTTTTTAPPPTTTTQPPTTTTTAPPTTTSTAPPTTTTTGPGSSTTTTAPTTTTTTSSTTTTTSSGVIVLGETLTKPDTPQVLGEQTARPAPGGPLAHTGAAIGLLAFIGGGLLWVGLPLSRYKRRKAED